MSRLFDDGSNQYCEHSGALLDGYPYSMGSWVYADDDASTLAAMYLGTTASAQFWDALFLRGAAAGDYVHASSHQHGGGPGLVAAITSSGFTINTWHHVLAVFVSGAERHIWIDGNAVGDDTTDISSGWNHNNFAIGGLRDQSPGDYFSGRIAEAAVWDGELVEANAITLYGKDAPSLVEPGILTAYWKLIDDDVDSIGSFDLTPNGSPTFTDHVPGMNYGGEPAAGNPVVKIMLQMDQFGGGVMK